MGAWIIVPILGVLLAIASFCGVPSNFQNKTGESVLSEQTQTVSPQSTPEASPSLVPSPSTEPSQSLIPTPTATPTPITPEPTLIASPKPTHIPTHIPTPTPTPNTNSGLSNNNTYTNSQGNEVHSPAYSNTVPTGATAICGDGTYSFSQSRRGTCSHHGGVAQWL